MLHILGTLVLAAVLTACRGIEPVRPDGTRPPEASPPARAVSSDTPDEPDTTPALGPVTVEITLERTECYGWCPSYTVTIYGDGRVDYVGRANVLVLGQHAGQVSQEVVRRLIDRFQVLGFLDLRDLYTQPVSDMPTDILTLRVGDRAKQVTNYGLRTPLEPWQRQLPDLELQARLFDLADAIDEAVAIEQWIGTQEQREVISRFPRGLPSPYEPPIEPN